MTAKGISNIRGLRSLNTRPGPITESNGFLRLYQLAVEKDNLLRKIAWVNQQKDQTEKRVAEIRYTMQVVEEKAKRESSSNVKRQFRSAFIQY